MIPPLVRKILWATAALSGVVFSYWVLKDLGSGIAFGLATAWAMANVIVWAMLIVAYIRPGNRDTGRAMAWLAVKFVLLAAGFAALVAAAPMRPITGWAVLAGVSSVLLVTVLTAVGAALTGVDLLEGRKKDSID
jgi:hypothetical protein